MKTVIQAELPQELVSQARAFVEEGWVGDFNELLAKALRHYLESALLAADRIVHPGRRKLGLHGRE